MGGGVAIDPKDYFSASASVQAVAKKKVILNDKPPANDTVGTARWMASTLTYGVLSSISTRTEGCKVGDPFGNPYSFADVGGQPYFWAAKADVSWIDFLTATKPNPRATLALSEAALTGSNNEQSACVVGGGLGDPENP